MTKIHPNAASESSASPMVKISPPIHAAGETAILTVWKKSLLFNCDGFTVFDSKGNLVFRVDNYDSAVFATPDIVLMDGAGAPLLSLRRKRISRSWHVYAGETGRPTSSAPIMEARRQASWRGANKGKVLARVFSGDGKEEYVVEGSYGRRCCAVYDRRRNRVAEIRRKEVSGRCDGRVVGFGCDVFTLVVEQSEIHSAVAMALVILLEQMFGSSTR